jgi:hypothetical protein
VKSLKYKNDNVKNTDTFLDTPVALVIFNRPKCTRRVCEAIRSLRPRQLFIIADGPRRDRPGEELLCAETREVAERIIDWPCEVTKDYSDENLGCGTRLPSGLTKMFRQVDRAIILEDDVLPDSSFFPFCEAMLRKYENRESIMQVGGFNRFSYNPGDSSYFFSRYCDIWGWATWASAWQHFNTIGRQEWIDIKRENILRERSASEREAEMRTFILDDIFFGRLNAWGMRWELTKIINHGIGVIPSCNLIKNIGFGLDASHTVNPFVKNRFVRVSQLKPPYIEPVTSETDAYYEELYHSRVCAKVGFEKVRTFLLRTLFRKKI